MTRKRFNKLRRTLCVQVLGEYEKTHKHDKKAHLNLNKMPVPVGIGNGKSYQSCWDELRNIVYYVPVSKVER